MLVFILKAVTGYKLARVTQLGNIYGYSGRALGVLSEFFWGASEDENDTKHVCSLLFEKRRSYYGGLTYEKIEKTLGAICREAVPNKARPGPESRATDRSDMAESFNLCSRGRVPRLRIARLICDTPMPLYFSSYNESQIRT